MVLPRAARIISYLMKQTSFKKRGMEEVSVLVKQVMCLILVIIFVTHIMKFVYLPALLVLAQKTASLALAPIIAPHAIRVLYHPVMVVNVSPALSKAVQAA